MRALFVSRHFPNPPEQATYGVFQRLRMFLEAAAGLCERLDVLFFAPPSFEINRRSIAAWQDLLRVDWALDINLFLSHLDYLEQPTTGALRYYLTGTLDYCNQHPYRQAAGTKQAHALLERLQDQPDFIFLHKLSVTCACRHLRKRLPPLFIDLDDLDYLALLRRLRQMAAWPGERLKLAQVPALAFGTRKAIAAARKAFVCSQLDKKRLSRFCRPESISVIPNAVPLHEAVATLQGTKTILFIGSYGYPPNADAAEFLIKQIWPRIQRHCPEAKLIIAGPEPEKIPSFQESPQSVEFTGFVRRLDELYKTVSVLCCPIRAGSGTRLKIIEAASYGVPVVSTTLGAEGLEFRNREEIYLSDDPEEMAGLCAFLLNNVAARQAVGSAARTAFVRHYERKAVIRRIQDELTAALSRRG
ncbi:glycosyltransferase [Pelomicrobium sp. G1]|uniref:glycosyltransferase family 4 protein n=1 Tax=unclassified Pelomicrobium TaxID=2815318 RepID=UPI003F763189